MRHTQDLLADVHPDYDPRDININQKPRTVSRKTQRNEVLGSPLTSIDSSALDAVRPRSTGFSPGHTRSLILQQSSSSPSLRSASKSDLNKLKTATMNDSPLSSRLEALRWHRNLRSAQQSRQSQRIELEERKVRTAMHRLESAKFQGEIAAFETHLLDVKKTIT